MCESPLSFFALNIDVLSTARVLAIWWNRRSQTEQEKQSMNFKAKEISCSFSLATNRCQICIEESICTSHFPQSRYFIRFGVHNSTLNSFSNVEYSASRKSFPVKFSKHGRSINLPASLPRAQIYRREQFYLLEVFEWNCSSENLRLSFRRLQRTKWFVGIDAESLSSPWISES